MEEFEQISQVDFEGYDQPVDLDTLTQDSIGEGSSPSYEDENSDYITLFLKRNNIDRSKIRVSDEDGNEEEVNFDDLDDDDKLSILMSTQEVPITDLEVATLNYLRSNRLNLAEFAEGVKQQAIQEYLAQNKSVNYTVDKISDEELYKLELTDKYPDLTDDEIDAEVDHAMQNEDLFKKKINAIRSEYKQLEDLQVAMQTQQQAQEMEANWNNLVGDIVNVARNTNELHDLILEDEDKEEVLSFLLDKDGNGQTQFIKLLEDPNMLFKLAWYALKGEEAFNSVNDYYKSEIAKSRRQSNAQPTKTVRRERHNSNSSASTYDLDSYFKQ